ncbi:MAG TPA: hypothetical protein VFM54_14280 [Micromonosporaceae bacterium]|nr:hypothetical protein [Micromonosporaceae bacterium]
MASPTLPLPYRHIYVVVRYDDPGAEEGTAPVPIEDRVTLAKAYRTYEEARSDAQRLNQLASDAGRECRYWAAITRLMTPDADPYA